MGKLWLGYKICRCTCVRMVQMGWSVVPSGPQFVITALYWSDYWWGVCPSRWNVFFSCFSIRDLMNKTWQSSQSTLQIYHQPAQSSFSCGTEVCTVHKRSATSSVIIWDQSSRRVASWTSVDLEILFHEISSTPDSLDAMFPADSVL